MDIIDETDEDEEMEDEVEEWGEREFVSDLSGEDADFTDLEDVSLNSDDNPLSDGAENEGIDHPKAMLGKRKVAAAPPSLRQTLKHTGKRQKRGPRVEVEYEHEMESVPLTKSALVNW